MKQTWILLLSLIINWGFMSCSSDEDENENLSSLGKELVGTWEHGEEIYYILQNGEGFYQEEQQKNDGICREVFTWIVEGDVLTLNYDGSSYLRSYKITFIEDGFLLLSDVSNGYERKWRRINKEGITSIDYKKPPYECYLKSDGYYYPLLKVVSKCDHGYGGESNFRFLQFFGMNGLLNPIGVNFAYSTPSWEGINSQWIDGIHIIETGGGYWVNSASFCKNGSWSYQCEGTLTIKTVNNMKVYDFELDDRNGHKATGHFIGTFK